MRIIRKILSLILAASVLLGMTFIPCTSFAASTAPNPTAEAAILMDMTTGKVLFEKNADKAEYPASTTKIMTCLLALENLDMQGRITADKEVENTGGSSLDLKDGEWVNTGILVSAMMVVSANDVAVALAKEISGNVDDFAVLMNERAKELGCTNTNFVNPNGLHNENHYSTARDIALIAQYAMKNEVFRRVVARDTFTVPVTNITLHERVLKNTNLLLNDTAKNNRVYVNGVLRDCKYDGCIGIKTGYTPEAGGCLVSAAERNGTTLLCVVLNSGSTERFSDSIELLDWGFDNYKTVTVLEEGYNAGTVRVKGGTEKEVTAVLPEDVIVTLPKDANESVLSIEIELSESVKAPLEDKAVLGTLKLVQVDKLISQYNLLAVTGVEKGTNSTLRIILLAVVILFALLILAFVLWIIAERRAAQRRKAAREARKAARIAEEAEKREEWERNYHNRYR